MVQAYKLQSRDYSGFSSRGGYKTDKQDLIVTVMTRNMTSNYQGFATAEQEA